MWTKSGWSILVAIAGFYAPAGWAQLPELAEPTIVAQRSDSGVADASFNRGRELFREGTAESLRAAIPYFDTAARLYEQGGDRARQASAQLILGRIYDLLDEKRRALEYYERALPLFRAEGDRGGEAVILNNIGKVYSDLGEKRRALEYFERALSLRKAEGDRSGEAITLSNIGSIYDNLGERQRALEYYNKALPLFRAAGDRGGEAVILNNIGKVYSDWGEKRRALEYYERSLSLKREIGDRSGEAVTLSNIGKVYSDLGEQQRALEYYERSLSLKREIGDRSGEAITLNNIGLVYSDLGARQRALEYYNKALPLFRAAGDRGGEAITLSNIGATYSYLGEKRRALEYYERALPPFRAVGDRAGEATTLNNIGLVYSDLGEQQQALEYYERALPSFRAVGARSEEATILNNIGKVYADLGEKRQALAYFNRALPLRRAVGDRSGEALTLNNIAHIKFDLGNLAEALTEIEAAIDIIETLRTQIVSPELRASYFASVQDLYRFYIKLLMQLHRQNPDRGYDALAFHASERSRARTLLELLREADADIRRGVDPELVAAERRLQQKLDAAETRRLEIFGDDNSTRTQKENIEAELAELLERYEEIRARIRAASPRYAALTQPQPLTLADVQQRVVDEETVLLQYSLGEETSYLWVVTPTEMSSYKLPGREEIETKANQFLSAITHPTRRINQSSVNAAARELSEMILQPAASQLRQKRLLISTDGILQNIPFSALTISRGEDYEPLIKQYEIVRSPSASAIAQIREDTASRTPATKTLAVFADPVFTPDDERVKNPTVATPPDELLLAAIPEPRGETRDAVDGWARLKYTRTEAETILGLVPETERTAAFDFDANLEAILNSEELQDYQIIHFATHGFANGRNPALSGLVFSLIDEGGNWQNGYLRLNDIFNLNLPAELVVLSACQTALGRDLEGEGMVGITRGFMYAGSPRLVASLWFVDDRGTSALMSKFYQKMLSENLSPSEAMRSAQLEMLASSEYNSPYYWAGFTFQGEWN